MEPGRRIGKYVLDERIAVGGMAEVWAAHVEGLQGFVKPVALKFILESFSGDPELERLFVNEARIAARLQHANLVTVFDFDKVGADQERGLAGRYYIAMERVEGQDLRRLSDAARRAGYVVPVGVALYIAGEVLKALRYVHERREGGASLGLVHRDVSPHNVLVGYTGEVKLSDFGIAKAREHSVRNTKPGSVRGKISYASPEQLAAGVVDHRTDQFAAGVTFWEILAGRRLFDGASDLEIIGKVARCEIPPIGASEGGRDVPPAVEAVVRRMLAPEPRARFATTAEALSAVLGLERYSPDGAPLGDLTRALFIAGAAQLTHTVPLSVATPPRAAQAETRTMNADAAGGSATRHARRKSEALARSPTAAAPRDAATTTEVRSRHGGKLVVALVVAIALGGAALARYQMTSGRAPSQETATVAPNAQPVVARATAVPAVASPSGTVPHPSPATTTAIVPPAPPVETERAVLPTDSDREGERHHAAHRHADAPADDGLVATPDRAAPKSSINGAPIIE